MNLFGIPLRQPSFGEFTAASVMATGLWMVGVAAMVQSGQPFGDEDLGALLAIVWWACTGVRFGIDLRAGGRHLAAHMVVALLLLGLNALAWACLR